MVMLAAIDMLEDPFLRRGEMVSGKLRMGSDARSRQRRKPLREALWEQQLTEATVMNSGNQFDPHQRSRRGFWTGVALGFVIIAAYIVFL